MVVEGTFSSRDTWNIDQPTSVSSHRELVLKIKNRIILSVSYYASLKF